MTLKYYIREKGNGAYCISEGEDILYNNDCVEVPPCPDALRYRWDNNSNEWVLNEELIMGILRSKRDMELNRTDKYMTLDYPISDEERKKLIQYRRDLRNCPNKDNLEDRVLPECPKKFIN